MGTTPDDEQTTSTSVVRTARLHDAARLGAINVDCWRYLHTGVLSDRFLDSLDAHDMGERWRDLLQAPPADQVFLVAEMDGVVTSYARGGPYRVPSDADPADDVSAWCEIYAIYTHPDHLGRGGGSAVHDAMIQTLDGFGHRMAYLWAADHDRYSYVWFGKRGWRPDGTTTMWTGVGEPLPETRLVHDLTPAPHV